MNFLDFLTGGSQTNPAEAAAPYLDKIPDVGKQYLDPYIQRGQESGDILADEYGSLINDPTALINKIMQGYGGSSMQTQTQNDAMRAMNNQAAAGGTLGSIPSMIDMGRVSGDISNRYQQDFLKQALGLYDTGLSGESHFNDIGADSSKALMDLLTNNLMNQSKLAYENQDQTNQNNASFIDSIGKVAGTVLPFLI